jgi:2'-5' RNA ligase
MAPRYLNEVRLGHPLKGDLREIIRDISETFDVHGKTQHRPVPHVSLFGPYDTDDGYAVKSRTQRVLQDFDVVPYEIDGFDHFDSETLYVNVEPSPELASLRRRLSAELRPLSAEYPEYDADREYEFHITVAFKDIEQQFDEIWQYANETYDLQRQAYAKRVTALDRREMMWEWDLPRGVALSQSEATSKASWEKTEAALEQHLSSRSEMDHHSKESGFFQKVLRRIFRG